MILLPVVGRSWLDDEELDAVVDEIVKYSSNIFTRFIGFFCLDSDCEPASFLYCESLCFFVLVVWDKGRGGPWSYMYSK